MDLRYDFAGGANSGRFYQMRDILSAETISYAYGSRGSFDESSSRMLLVETRQHRCACWSGVRSLILLFVVALELDGWQQAATTSPNEAVVHLRVIDHNEWTIPFVPVVFSPWPSGDAIRVERREVFPVDVVRLPPGIYTVSLPPAVGLMPYRRAAIRLRPGSDTHLVLRPVLTGGTALEGGSQLALPDPKVQYDVLSSRQANLDVLIRYEVRKDDGLSMVYTQSHWRGMAQLTFDNLSVQGRSIRVISGTVVEVEGHVLVEDGRTRRTADHVRVEFNNRLISIYPGGSFSF
jgi:hypothetical protein